MLLSRRLFIAGAAAGLAGCTTTRDGQPEVVALPRIDPTYARMYDSVVDGGFVVPRVDVAKIDPQFLRQEVDDPTGERPGTIVVVPAQHFLYLVREDGRALRYGVGVGRAGFEWGGLATIQRIARWPTWTPPIAMQKRQPETAKWAGGMPGGLDNPLGARALYLYEGGRDTLYRIHGTNEPWSIGQSVSSGCIRMLNQDAIDLYNRVPIGTRVVVRQDRAFI